MKPFTIHWSQVPHGEDGAARFAIWPAPVNPDVCFEKAGFADFGDGDENWDLNANQLLTNLLEELCVHGSPQLSSPPVKKHQSWYRRFFTEAEVYGLREQIELPIQWDSLPDCIVLFGESGVSLRTGSGHHIFWITLLNETAATFAVLVERIAYPHPTVRTDLKWDFLV